MLHLIIMCVCEIGAHGRGVFSTAADFSEAHGADTDSAKR